MTERRNAFRRLRRFSSAVRSSAFRQAPIVISGYSGITVALITWFALSIRAFRALQSRHSLRHVRWWLPAAAGVLAQLLAIELFPPPFSHIEGFPEAASVMFAGAVGLLLTKGSNLLLMRSYRSGKDLRERQR